MAGVGARGVDDDLDRQVRDQLAPFGPTYAHHTGHGLGATFFEYPYVVPGSTDVLEEDMVLALEPAVYRPGWGGVRLEQVVLIRADGAEPLSQLEFEV